MKGIFLAFASAVFAYAIFLVAIRNMFPDGIVFYQGVAICLFVSLAICFIMFLVKLPATENMLVSVAIFFMLYSVNITFPALLDRSISYYIIGITAKDGSADIDRYRQGFYNGFVVNNKAIEKRLNEQIATGNITCNDGVCYLTSKGKALYRVNLFLATLLKLDTRYVDPVNY